MNSIMSALGRFSPPSCDRHPSPRNRWQRDSARRLEECQGDAGPPARSAGNSRQERQGSSGRVRSWWLLAFAYAREVGVHLRDRRRRRGPQQNQQRAGKILIAPARTGRNCQATATASAPTRVRQTCQDSCGLDRWRVRDSCRPRAADWAVYRVGSEARERSCHCRRSEKPSTMAAVDAAPMTARSSQPTA